MNENTNLAQLIYQDLEKNDYLIELYSKLLYSYAKIILLDSKKKYKIELSDALRFADLLSKSTNKEKEIFHKQIAQEMITLISELYSDRPEITQYLGSILVNNGNFPGIMQNIPAYKSADQLERIYEHYIIEEYKIPNEKDLYFSKDQKKVYEHFDDESFSYSGPTSMGKSFLIKHFIKEKILSKTNPNFVFLVPTNALINEISIIFHKEFKTLLKDYKYRIITVTESILLSMEDNHFVFILTPERLLYHLMNYPNTIIDYIFIDEAHKMVSYDGRSTFYFKIIDYLMKRHNIKNPKIIFSSPNIPNPYLFQNTISNNDIANTSISINQSPVNQFKFIIDYKTNEIKVYNTLVNQVQKIIDFDDDLDFYSLLARTSNLQDSIKKNRKQTIVYCSSIKNAINFAVEFANSIETPKEIPEEILNFSNELKEDISEHYFLVELIKKGIAFHVGYLPNKTRIKLEKLFRDNYLTVMFCTSTLIEGVNFPAKNLFITSSYKGCSPLSQIDFKNLLGRVGRIQYNLFGNIYMINFDNSKNHTKKYEEFLTKKVKDQKLSIEKGISKSEKRYIVDLLANGETTFIKGCKRQSQNYQEFELMKKTANILLHDIMNDNNSLVVKEFEPYLKDKKEIIKRKFANNKHLIDNDINISIDQTLSIQEMIKTGQIKYPEFYQNDYNRCQKIRDFLEKMCVAFNWDQLEKSWVGNKNENGLHPKFSYYATMINKWISGQGINFITHNSIEYYENNIGVINVKIDRFNYEIYNGSALHKNYIIANTLDTIENEILFSINNYFIKFSKEYKKIFPDDDTFVDWQDFIEYGTTDVKNIFLQKAGLSRETALYIKKYNYFAVDENNNAWIKKEIFSCNNKSVIEECEYLKINIPELFEL